MMIDDDDDDDADDDADDGDDDDDAYGCRWLQMVAANGIQDR